MTQDRVVRVSRAPWGRKKFYAPLPILSVVLVAAAVAAPSLLHTTFTFFNDGSLTISAVVQNVIHSGGPTGKIVGFLIVTNAHSFAINLTSASAVVTSGTVSGGVFVPDASPVILTVPLRAPLLVPAGATVKQQFSGSFTGSVLGLSPTASFRIVPFVQWVEVHSPTDLVGPFTYATTKVCPSPMNWIGTDPNGWNTQCTA